jgi:hypothetical protein
MPAGAHFSVHPIYRSYATTPAIVTMAFSPDGQRLAFGDVVGRLVIMRDIFGHCAREFDSLITAEEPVTSLSWLAGSPRCGAIHTSQAPRFADLVAGDEEGYVYAVSPCKSKAFNGFSVLTCHS